MAQNLTFYKVNTLPETGIRGGVYFVKDTGKIYIYNSGWEDYTNRAISDINGNTLIDNYTRKIRINCPGDDYTDFVILLCNLDNTYIYDDFYTYGTVYFKRKNGLDQMLNKIDVCVCKFYNKEQPNVASMSRSITLHSIQFVTCKYHGKPYAAIQVFGVYSNYSDSSWFIGESNNATSIQAIPYYNHKTTEVLNEEIKNSIALVTTQIQGSVLYGTSYISYDGSNNYYEIITSKNISSQSVNYATTSEVAKSLTWEEYD